MGLNCCGICTKVMLIFTNIIYMLISVGIVGFGTFFLIHHDDIELVIGNETIGWFIVFILVGLFVFINGLFGVISTSIGNHKLLIAYMISIMIMIIVLCAGSGVSATSAERNTQKVGDQFKTFMKEYRPSGCTLNGEDCQYNEDADNAVDIVQEYLTCCGFNGPSDWYNMSYDIPESCTCDNTNMVYCRTLNNYERLHLNYTSDTGILKEGCNSTLEGIVVVHFAIISAFTLLLAVGQFALLLMTVGLCVCILRARKHQHRIEHLQSVAYTPLDYYPGNTVSNNQFITNSNHNDDNDEPIADGGEIKIQY